jgi:hypothetical protein
MYTRLSRDTGMTLDYELAEPYQHNWNWSAVSSAWNRFTSKTTKTGGITCAQ